MRFENSHPEDPDQALSFATLFRQYFNNVVRQLKESNHSYPYEAMTHLAQMGVVMTPLEFAAFWNSMTPQQILDLCTYVALNR